MDDIEEFKIPEDAIERLKDPDTLKKYISEGMTFQEIIGYDDERMRKFYHAASAKFENGDFNGASEAFTFLTTLNPNVYNYWVGLAMSEQMMEEYHGALLAYAMASMADPSNPIPLYHSAMCYKQILDDTSAITSLDLCILHCQDDEQHKELKQNAEAIRAQLKKRNL